MHQLRLAIVTLLLCFVLAAPALAATLRVPSQFPDPATALMNAQSGDRVVIRGGTWGVLFLPGLTLPSGLEIVGRRRPAFSEIELDGMVGLTLKGLRVDGGIDIGGNSTGVVVERCQLFPDGIGIRVQAGSDAILRRNVILLAETGIQLEGDSSTVFGNRIEGSDVFSILVTGDGNAVDRNRVDQTIGVPADEGGSANAFTRNEVIGSVSVGIELGGFANSAAANRVKRSQGHGIVVTGTGGHTVQNNRIINAGDDGIKIRDDPDETTHDNATNNSITKNRIRGTGGDGIDCENPDNTIDGNRIRGASDNGLEFGQEGNGNTVSNNRARRSGLFDLFDDAGGNTYLDNVLPRVDPEGFSP